MIPNLLRKYAFPATTRLETTKGIRKIPKMQQRKYKKDLKLIFNNIFYFPTEDDFKHCDNCKVCVNNETEKVNVQTPHVQNISVPLKHQKLKGKI